MIRSLKKNRPWSAVYWKDIIYPSLCRGFVSQYMDLYLPEYHSSYSYHSTFCTNFSICSCRNISTKSLVVWCNCIFSLCFLYQLWTSNHGATSYLYLSSGFMNALPTHRQSQSISSAYLWGISSGLTDQSSFNNTQYCRWCLLFFRWWFQA